jgi:ABC-type Fe3+/spermidine/putrescine transport system ATPase subunit
VISITDLRKNFQSGDHDVAALRGINLEVSKGEFFVLLGPSGSGKTTLLRSVAGLEKPSAGDIILNGKLVFSSGRGISEPPEAREIGMVFQSYAIWPHLTVAENIGFPLRQRGAEKFRLWQNAEEQKFIDEIGQRKFTRGGGRQ